MANEYQLTLNDYAMIVRRRAGQIIATFVVVFLIALAIAIAVPPLYQSTGTIVVESQQIPLDLVPATASALADERIQLIKQRVMTRENLSRIIEKYGLFVEQKDSMTASQIIDEMRDRVGIELISADLGGRRRGQATIAFKLSFEHRSPNTAHRVANELVTLFLQENAKARTERATETTAFLTQEADKLKLELEALENQLASYKQQYGNALPEHLELHMGMLQRAEADLRSVERDYKTAEGELRYLDVQLAAAQAGVGATDTQTVMLSPAQELTKLQAQYDAMSGSYTSTHPDMRALANKIEALRAELKPKGAPAAGEVTRPTSLLVAGVQAKVGAAKARLISLAEQEKNLKSRIRQLEAQVIQTPQVERALVTLMRDHESAQRKYQEVRAKQADAQIVESLEQDKKAERFSLLEPPLLPDTPIKPNRPKIMLMGFFVALGASGGLAFLLEMLSPRVRGAGALAALMRQPPLVEIPYITTRREIGRRRRRIMIAIAVAAALLALSIALVHFFYKPLDILFFKIIARLG